VAGAPDMSPPRWRIGHHESKIDASGRWGAPFGGQPAGRRADRSAHRAAGGRTDRAARVTPGPCPLRLPRDRARLGVASATEPAWPPQGRAHLASRGGRAWLRLLGLTGRACLAAPRAAPACGPGLLGCAVGGACLASRAAPAWPRWPGLLARPAGGARLARGRCPLGPRAAPARPAVRPSSAPGEPRPASRAQRAGPSTRMGPTDSRVGRRHGGLDKAPGREPGRSPWHILCHHMAATLRKR
jgi:hypothetical protein